MLDILHHGSDEGQVDWETGAHLQGTNAGRLTGCATLCNCFFGGRHGATTLTVWMMWKVTAKMIGYGVDGSDDWLMMRMDVGVGL